MWNRRIRTAAFLNAIVIMAWTVAIVLPFEPFSYILVIIERGGPGTWFLLAYLLFLTVGVLGFGAISSIIYVIEEGEGKRLPSALALAGFALAYAGTMASCLLLAYAGLVGGYSLYIADMSIVEVAGVLGELVGPTAAASIVAVLGYAALIASMMKAS